MKIMFHSFCMGDVDDIDIYVAAPLYEWQQTEQGRWAMQHATDLKYHTSADADSFGYRISITGTVPEGPLLTEYLLRYNG